MPDIGTLIRGSLGCWFLFLSLAETIGLAAEDEIRITSITFADNRLATLKWEGGTPPFFVWALADDSGWMGISGYVFGREYQLAAPWDSALFQVQEATDSLPPAVPTGLEIIATSCNRVALQWAAAEDDPRGSGVGGYCVYRDGVAITNLPASSTFFLDRSVQPGTNLSYAVEAIDRVDNRSGLSAAIVAVTPPCLQGSGGGPSTSVSLAWDQSEEHGVIGYLVYWGMGPQNYTWVVDAMDETSLTVPDLLPGEIYFFAITAYNQDEVQSVFSFEVPFIIPSAVP